MRQLEYIGKFEKVLIKQLNQHHTQFGLLNIHKLLIKYNQQKNMKPSSMKAPPLEQIYNQRYQYEQHKKKLMRIYEDRKSQLGYDTTRMSHFEQLKQSKTKSFIHKFNQQNSSIAKQNLKLLGKLQHAKPSLNHSASEEKDRSSFSYITPFVKKRMLQTEKQNMRISNRMRNMSSSLNQKNFVKDYAKSQQIKQRLMRYTADQSRVYLKSERYFGQNDGNQSVMSSQSKDKHIKQLGNSSQPRRLVIKPNLRKTAISHYKKQDILKNKVDTSTSNLAGIRSKAHRPNTSIEAQKINAEVEQQNAFFTTQPNRQKKLLKKKVYV